MSDFLERLAMNITDQVFGLLPQKKPKKEFKDFNIISHRGCHDNKTILENSLAAFKRARQAPIYGIEFDVRWTKDMVPVVFHDSTLQRIYKDPRKLSDIPFAKLRENFPLIPKLEEVIKENHDLHLMIEIKKDPELHWEKAVEILKPLIMQLEPEADFHLIALEPEHFFFFKYLPPKTFLPIAKTNIAEMSKLSLEKGWGGITGHYLMTSQKYVSKHHSAQQIVGTGFPTSLNGLYREVNRGVDFIFTNHSNELFKAH